MRAEYLQAAGSRSRVTRLAEPRPPADRPDGAVRGRWDRSPQHCSQPAGLPPARMRGTGRFRGLLGRQSGGVCAICVYRQIGSIRISAMELLAGAPPNRLLVEGATLQSTACRHVSAAGLAWPPGVLPRRPQPSGAPRLSDGNTFARPGGVPDEQPSEWPPVGVSCGGRRRASSRLVPPRMA